MTDNKIQEMNEREQEDLARQLAATSETLDFDGALQIVRWRPANAEKLIRMEKEMVRRQEERDRARKRRKLALREDFG